MKFIYKPRNSGKTHDQKPRQLFGGGPITDGCGGGVILNHQGDTATNLLQRDAGSVRANGKRVGKLLLNAKQSFGEFICQ